MKINQMKVPLGRMIIDNEMKEAAMRALQLGMTTEGAEVEAFEKSFAEYIGTKYCIAVSSGTAALFTIFQALKSNYRHARVLTSPLTYMATYNAPNVLEYDVDFVDVEIDTYSMDIAKVNKMDKVDILLPVHLLGYPVDLRKLKHDTIVIEDACEAVGSKYDDKKVGSFGFAGAYSFYPSHTIQVGEMGAITTNDELFAYKCRLIKDNGRNRRDHANAFVHKYTGFNFKTSDVMAAIANVQLERIDEIVSKRQSVAKFYSDELSNLDFRAGKYDERCAYLGYPIICKDNKSTTHLSIELGKRGIETRFMFPLVYSQPAVRVRESYDCPVAQRISSCGIYIPCHQYMTYEEMHYVVKSIKHES